MNSGSNNHIINLNNQDFQCLLQCIILKEPIGNKLLNSFAEIYNATHLHNKFIRVTLGNEVTVSPRFCEPKP